MTGSRLCRRRRTLLTTVPATLLMTAGIPRILSAALAPPGDRLSFQVTRAGDELGTHVVSFSQAGNRLIVDVAIDLEVRFAFITAFRYRHRNREVWEDGRLIAMDSETDDDGEQYRVSARAEPEGLVVDGSRGRFTAPADVIPTSYWNREIVEQSSVLDTQKGRMRDIAVRPGGLEQVAADGRTIPARRYTFSGDLELAAWYSETGQWVKLAFMARGAEVDYELDNGVADVTRSG